MNLSVLDQSPACEGQHPASSIRESLALAQHCEFLGYSRYWLSEHHSSDAIAGAAPEILMAAIAATTSRIRIGSAGIMLPHYSALKVAEQFRTLEALAPNRIDLGVGRAPGSDGRTALALNPNAASAADNFPSQLRDLMAWTAGGPLPENHPFRTIRAQPQGPTAPEIWVLGSSLYGAQVAAFFGLPYCYAYFFSDGQGAEEALNIYRETYRPTEQNPRPHSAITVWALAADTQQEADYHYQPRAIARLMRDRGHYIALPSPEAAAAIPLTDIERAHIARIKAAALCGTAPEIATRLKTLTTALGIDELAITTSAYSPQARRHSYTLLANEFSLPAIQKAA